MTDPTGIREQVRLREHRDTSFREIHDEIFPADVRSPDAVKARITARNGKGSPHQCRVWKLSPLGIEISVDPQNDLKIGDTVELELRTGLQLTSHRGLIVGKEEHHSLGDVFGIRFLSNSDPLPSRKNRRSHTRWLCSSQFHPVAVCPNPVVFNDFLYFTIRDISASGFRAHTSLRNKFLVSDMKLCLQVSFPMTGHCVVHASVARTSLTSYAGKDYLEVGLVLDELSRRQQEMFGQYLVQFSNAPSPNAVRLEGLKPRSISTSITFSYVKTEAEFIEVLKLRKLANERAEKIESTVDLASLTDSYDSKSRIVIAKHRGKLVGTMRACFFESDERLELESFTDLPDVYPRRDQLIEVSRAATHPDYRKADLWYSMVQQISIAAMYAGRPFAVISTTKELTQMYSTLGFVLSRLEYKNPLYPKHTQYVMHIDLKAVLKGQGVGPLAWNTVWRDIADYALRHDIYSSTEISNTRTRLYRLVSAPANFIKAFAKSMRT